MKAASSTLTAVPAQYQTVTERVLVKQEHTIRKKGSGAITKVSETTGEIMCLVTIPAEYKTLTRRDLVSAATTREIEIPAEYTTVKRKVMTSPPSTRMIDIPAEYKTVKVRRVANAASGRTIDIPATYQTVSSRKLVADGYLQWRSILCETNMTPGTVLRMQTALKRAGHYNGPIDGVVGTATIGAIRSYQNNNGLSTGGITMETLKKLQVSI
ncbi:MAG: hypothetical protein ACI915_002263 [Gammaproteobacteria bacterium]